MLGLPVLPVLPVPAALNLANSQRADLATGAMVPGAGSFLPGKHTLEFGHTKHALWRSVYAREGGALIRPGGGARFSPHQLYCVGCPICPAILAVPCRTALAWAVALRLTWWPRSVRIRNNACFSCGPWGSCVCVEGLQALCTTSFSDRPALWQKSERIRLYMSNDFHCIFVLLQCWDHSVLQCFALLDKNIAAWSPAQGSQLIYKIDFLKIPPQQLITEISCGRIIPQKVTQNS